MIFQPQTCRWCGATYAADGWTLHQGFHVTNDLHRHDCSLLQTKISQRGTGMYLTPQPCSCGLGEALAEYWKIEYARREEANKEAHALWKERQNADYDEDRS